MGFVSGDSRDQGALFPTTLDELIPEEHLVRVLDAFVDRQDLAGLGFLRARPAATGRPPYDPGDLLRLYLYGYLNQVRSSRRLERECARNVELMWLMNRLAPDFKTIAQFRRDNAQGLKATCAAFVQFCRGAGLLGGEWVAIDGSKLRAVASNKAVFGAGDLAREQAKLEAQAQAYLEQLERADAGEAEAADPPAPQRLREALAQLRAKQADVQTAQALLGAVDSAQHVRGEPEARLMRTAHGFAPAYNLQAAVDAKHALVVAHELTAEPTDNRSLLPTAQAAKQALQTEALNVVADAGYSNGEQAAQCERVGIVPHVPANRSVNAHDKGRYFERSRFQYDSATDTYRCPAGERLARKQRYGPDRLVIYTTGACAHCALKAQCTGGKQRFVSRHFDEEALRRMQGRIDAAPELMRLRRCLAEHPFGTLKNVILGNGRLLLRGMAGAGGEVALALLAYNFKRVTKILGVRGLLEQLQGA
jgi:transposase